MGRGQYGEGIRSDERKGGGDGGAFGTNQSRPFGPNWGKAAGALPGSGGGAPFGGGGGNTYINPAGVPGDTALDVAGAYGAAPGAGPGAYAGGAATAASGASGLSQWLDPRTLAALGLSGLSAINGFRQPAGMGNLNDIFNLSMDRAKATGPLFEQMLRMTQSQMPDYTKGQG